MEQKYHLDEIVISYDGHKGKIIKIEIYKTSYGLFREIYYTIQDGYKKRKRRYTQVNIELFWLIA